MDHRLNSAFRKYCHVIQVIPRELYNKWDKNAKHALEMLEQA